MQDDRLPLLNSLKAFDAAARHESPRIRGRGLAGPEGRRAWRDKGDGMRVPVRDRRGPRLRSRGRTGR